MYGDGVVKSLIISRLALLLMAESFAFMEVSVQIYKA